VNTLERKNKMYLSIVIPCHNEEVAIPKLCRSLEKVLIKNLRKPWEVFLINDVSTDNTLKKINSISRKNPKFKVINLEKRGGQTGAYRAAFKVATGKYILRMDGDMQDDPEDLPLFLDKMANNYDVIVGIREARKASKFLRFATQVYNLAGILLFNLPFREGSSSYVVFKSNYLKNLDMKHNDHRYLVLISHLRGLNKPGEVVVRNHPRLGGKSKYNSYRKLVFGIPEFIRFIIRAKRGYYN
tara:strand:- start:165 stop:890 length:726 start_codon:yes stop_codon:yes gene_type:complete